MGIEEEWEVRKQTVAQDCKKLGEHLSAIQLSTGAVLLARKREVFMLRSQEGNYPSQKKFCKI